MKKFILLSFVLFTAYSLKAQDPCDAIEVITEVPDTNVYIYVEPLSSVDSLHAFFYTSDTAFVANADSGLLYNQFEPGEYYGNIYIYLNDGTFCSDSLFFVVDDPSTLCDNWEVAITNDDSLVTLTSSTSPANGPFQWLIVSENDIDTITGMGPILTAVLPEGNYTMLIEGFLGSEYCSQSIIYTVSYQQDPTCTANFAIYPDSTIGSSIFGYNYSEGEDLNYLWYFGDGSTSTEAYPEHTYAEEGTYLVILFVESASGDCTDSMGVYIQSPGMIPDGSNKPSGNNVFAKSGSFTLNILAPGETITSIGEPQEIVDRKLWPNPSEGTVYMQFTATEAGPAVVKIFDISGKTIFVKQVNLTKGQNNLDFDLSNIDSGIYYLNLSKNNSSYSSKFLINK